MPMTTAFDRRLLTTTSETAVFTASAAGAVITQIVAANITGTAATITVTLNDAASGKIAVLGAVSVAANSTLVVDLKQPLAASKQVFATAGTANAIAVHVAGVNL